MDQIKIEHLEVFANHGVFPEETKLGQKFLVNATLFTDTREAGLADDLRLSIHYGDACRYVTEFLTRHTYRLIEAAAEHLAMAMLLDIPRLRRVALEIKKPWAPIGLPLESVSVAVDRGWHTAYLSIGSNLGDKDAYLQGAVCSLGEIQGCKVKKVSDFFTTKPYGGVPQEDFLNACLEVDTLLTPEELLGRIHQIEDAAGRERTIRWGPRTLDIDILLYGKEVIETEDLAIPHVDMHNRLFVLEPLSQIAPNVRHPILHLTVSQMLQVLAGRE